MLIELEIEADNRAHRGRHGLLAIALAQVRLQPLLGLLGFHEDEPRRLAVRSRGPHLHEIHKPLQKVVRHLARLPGAMRARLEKQLIERIGT
jgi:hypothetical protein